MLKVYKKKRNSIHDYLHKVTRAVVDYCKANDIHTVIIGDITNIRRNKNLGKVTNQKLHALPYAKIYGMLEYKLAMHGITLVKQTEEYSSQCSPHAPQVTKEYAKKCNRTNRGLYKDQLSVYNADALGAAVQVSWTHPESVWRSHIYLMLGNSITDVVHARISKNTKKYNLSG